MKIASNIKALLFDFFIFFNVIRMFQGCFLQFLSLCLLFRCLQSMPEKEVKAYVLIILQARIAIDKKGSRKYIPLSKNKDAVLKKSRLYGFCMVLDYLLSLSGYGQKLKIIQ